MNWRHLLTRLDGAYSPRTIKGYSDDFEGFADWCRRKRLKALPAAPKTIARYIDERAKTHKISSIKRSLTAIKKVHRLAGYDTIASDEEVVLAVRRAKRVQPGRPRQALGITFERRERLLAQCGQDLSGLQNQVLVAVGFDTLCRRSELVALRIEDLHLHPSGTYAVLVRRAKNDQSGDGRLAHLSPTTSALVRKWVAAIGSDRGPLLRPVYKSRAASRFLSAGTVARLLKSLAEKAFDAETATKVTGHSLRVGAAQSLTSRGVGLLPIMSAGGWKSVASVARYVENVETNLWQ